MPVAGHQADQNIGLVVLLLHMCFIRAVSSSPKNNTADAVAGAPSKL